MQRRNDQSTVTSTDLDTAVVTTNREQGERLSEAVVGAVAEATGEDPTSMRPLYEVVDPDALDRLFEPGSTPSRQSPVGRVSFRYNGCDVTVHADGRTMVSERGD